MTWKGNPDNPAPNQLFGDDNVSDKKETVNRSTVVRRDNDKIKNFTVNLLDIDTSILEYLDNIINPTVSDGGENVKVPVFYGSPERWKSIQSDGGIRDNNGKLQLPAIMFKRNTVAKNTNLMTLNRHLNIPSIRKFDEKNKYDKFSLMTNRIAPVTQILNVTLPDHITLTYEFMLWTEYVEQMNALIEKINFASEEYWGDPKRFKFRVYINDYSNTTDVQSGKDRMVRTTFSMTVHGYLLSDSLENKKLTTTKTISERKVVISSESVSSDVMNQVKNDVKNTSYKKPYPYTYSTGLISDNELDSIRSPVVTNTEDASAYTDRGTMSPKISSILNSYKNLKTSKSCCDLWHNPPKTETEYGEEGWMAYDDNFHYIYVNGKWLRQPLANFETF
jgi:hypothetical protein